LSKDPASAFACRPCDQSLCHRANLSTLEMPSRDTFPRRVRRRAPQERNSLQARIYLARRPPH
jgi:hypothetical protein